MKLTEMTDISGQRFGRLIALHRAVTAARSGFTNQWVCRCDCGNERAVRHKDLTNGKVKSCGCLKREVSGYCNRTHGLTAGGKKTDRTMKAWSCAKSRCYNERDPRYKTYGARGITMCQEWRGNFLQFLSDMGECPPGLTLERIDNNRAYEPGNCRWATRADQARNKSTNLVVQWRGETRLVKDVASEMGLGYSGLRYRVKYLKQDIDTAVTGLLLSTRTKRATALRTTAYRGE